MTQHVGVNSQIARTLGTNNERTPYFAQRPEGLDPMVDPRVLRTPTLDASTRQGTYTCAADVVEGLGLPEDVRERAMEAFVQASVSDRPMVKAMAGPLRMLRKETGDQLLVREAGLRFAAMVGNNGLVKGMSTPPAGFSPVGGASTGYRKRSGASYVYWYPGEGISRKSPQAKEAEGQQQQEQPGQKQKPGGKPAAKKPNASAAAQGEGEAQPEPTIEDRLGGHDPEAFNALPKHAKAKETAHYADLGDSIGQHGPAEDYDTASPQTVRASTTKHIRQLVSDGTLGPATSKRVMALSTELQSAAKKAKVGPKTQAAMLQRTISTLAAQESRKGGSIRHIASNIQAGNKILDSVKAKDPKDRLMLALVMVNHDVSEGLPAFTDTEGKVDNDYAATASRSLWEQQPELAEAIGNDRWAKGGAAIESHATNDMDFEKDPVGSAVRLADALSPWAEKSSDALLDNPRSAELIAKLLTIKESGGEYADEGVKSLQAALSKQVDGRADLSMTERAQLHEAIDGIDTSTREDSDKYAAKEPKFAFKDGRMTVTVQQDPGRGALAALFNETDEEKRLLELAESDAIDVKITKAKPEDAKKFGDVRAKAKKGWDEVTGAGKGDEPAPEGEGEKGKEKPEPKLDEKAPSERSKLAKALAYAADPGSALRALARW